jgi:hypothetical protein
MGDNVVSGTGSSVMANAYALGPFYGANLRGKLSVTTPYVGADVIVETGLGTENTYVPYGFNGTYAWDQQFTLVPVITHAILRSPNIPIGDKIQVYAKAGKMDVVEYVTCPLAATDGNGPTTAFGGNYWVPRSLYIPGAQLGATFDLGAVTLTGEALALTESFTDSGNYYYNGRLIVAANKGATSLDVSVGSNRTDTDDGDGTSYTGAKNHVIAAFNQTLGPVTASVMGNYWHSGDEDPIKQHTIEVIPQVNVSVPFAGKFSVDGNVAHSVSETHQDFSTVSIADDDVATTSNGWDESVPGSSTIDETGLTAWDNQTILRLGVGWDMPKVRDYAQKLSLAGTVMTDWNVQADITSGDRSMVGAALVYKGSFQ